MSGGSWEYLYIKLEDAAERLLHCDCAYRRALGERLLNMSHAMHDIEWVDSCDYGNGDDIEAIKKALGKEHKSLAWAQMRNEAIDLIKRLEEFTDKES